MKKNVTGACNIPSIQADGYGDAFALVKEGDCSDAPQCDGNSSFNPPLFMVKEITPSYYTKLDLCDKKELENSYSD